MARHSLRIVALLSAIGLLCALSPALAQQQSSSPKADVGFGLKGIGARIGYVSPENVSGTAALGVHVDAGTIVRGVHLIPYVEYWSAGVDIAGLSADESDLTIASDVNMDFPMSGSRITPYIGGGMGLHFLSFSSNVIPDNSETKFGLNVQGGIRNQIMPNISLFGEVRYAFVSNANQLKIMGGFTYNFIY